jgi:hypothetical protein
MSCERRGTQSNIMYKLNDSIPSSTFSVQPGSQKI